MPVLLGQRGDNLFNLLVQRLLGINTDLWDSRGPGLPSHPLNIVKLGPGVRYIVTFRQAPANPLMGDFRPADTFNGEKHAA